MLRVGPAGMVVPAAAVLSLVLPAGALLEMRSSFLQSRLLPQRAAEEIGRPTPPTFFRVAETTWPVTITGVMGTHRTGRGDHPYRTGLASIA